MSQDSARSLERPIHALTLSLLWKYLRVGVVVGWASLHSMLAQMFLISFRRGHRARKKHLRLHCFVHCARIFSVMIKHPSDV